MNKIFIVCPPNVVSAFQKEFRDRVKRDKIENLSKTGVMWNIPKVKKCHHKDDEMGYLQHMAWLKWMSKRYKRERCRICGLFAVWRKK